MQYRKFGKTGKDVSVLGFGCMRLPIVGGKNDQIDEEKASMLLRKAIDKGVNYVDTAFPYHSAVPLQPGNSELFLSRALGDGYRDKVMLATKLPSWAIKSRDDMDTYLNEQLKRLNTDHIDCYLVHALMKPFWANLVPLGLFDFLDSAKKDGRIRYAGFSFHDEVGLFKEIVDAYDWSFCQIQYNYMDETYQAGREGLEYAAKRNLGMVIMEPLRGGALARNIPPTVQKIWNDSNVKRSPAAWALKFLWDKPDIHVVLSGMNEIEQLEENLNVANDTKAHSLSADEHKTLACARDAFRERIKVNCTACGYCMPCPIGVNIPLNFTHYNNLSIFEDAAASKFQYSIFVQGDQKASHCVSCGRCEELCPQHIPIRKTLKEVVKAFG